MRRAGAAHECVDGGKAVLGPGVNRKVRLSEQQHACHAALLADGQTRAHGIEAMQVRMQDGRAERIGRIAQRGFERRFELADYVRVNS